MKKPLLLPLLACLSAPPLGAAALQDWSSLAAGTHVGAFADAAGTTVTYAAARGPRGTRALRLDAKLVQWGGVWATVHGALPADGALGFRARSSRPMALRVDLNDSRLRSVVHTIRLRGGDWERFDLPVSAFAKPRWGNPKAAAGAFNLARLASVAFSPSEAGACEVLIGPLEAVAPAPALRDGAMAPGTVQDFVALPASAYGPFADTLGSSIALSVRAGAPGVRGPAALFTYDERAAGWCGEWIRAGAAWGGQDWRRARGLEAEVYSPDPLTLQFDFNDANQDAYVSAPLAVEPGAWTTVKADFTSFKLNPYYQPPRAAKGAPLDLSRVDTFNVTPMTAGRHSFWVRLVRLER